MAKVGYRGLFSFLTILLLSSGLFAVFGCSGRVQVEDSSRCPECGSQEVLPIVYGLPGSDMLEMSERGEILLGG